MSRRSTLLPAVVFLAFALTGVWFAGFSTYDFILHLDGQTHSVACSYLPGVGSRDLAGTSGCHAVMMSPWSSVLRSATWAGVPIALPGLAVFLYLVFLGLDFLVQGKHAFRRETAYLLAAAALPMLTSIAYWIISVVEVGEVCKLCVGIYVASFGVYGAALAMVIFGASAPSDEAPARLASRYAVYFAEGLLFVGFAVALHLGLKPAYEDRHCGELVKPEDRMGVMLPPADGAGAVPAVEIVDPLCPACRVFRERLHASDIGAKLAVRTVLFPLDNECNWMVHEPLHHGACLVARAALCAKEPAALIDWALKDNVALRELARDGGPAALRARVTAEFPEVEGCIDKPETRAKINQSLRWIAANSLSVLTPQLFVNNRKLCDEDMDLGLEYGLDRLIQLVALPEGR